jgi:hypothetical protein
VGLVIALVLAGISASGVITMRMTHVMFVLAFVVGVTAAALAMWLMSRSVKYSVIALATSAIVLGVVLLSLDGWLHRERAKQDAQSQPPLTNTSAPAPQVTTEHEQAAAPPKVRARSARALAHIGQRGNGGGAVGGSVQQGPCSIAQVGGTNNQASVNCVQQPPPPNVKFTTKELEPGVGPWTLVPHWSIGGHTAASDAAEQRRKSFADNPGVLVQMFLDGPWPNATFAAVCDRPCEGMDAIADNSVSSSGQGRINDTTVLVGFVVPSPLPANFPIKWEIRSQSKEKVSISKIVLALPK